jgi:hypothetical protein
MEAGCADRHDLCESREARPSESWGCPNYDEVRESGERRRAGIERGSEKRVSRMCRAGRRLKCDPEGGEQRNDRQNARGMVPDEREERVLVAIVPESGLEPVIRQVPGGDDLTAE